MLVIQIPWIVKVKEGAGHGAESEYSLPSWGLPESLVSRRVHLEGGVRGGLGPSKTKRWGNKFHKNFIFYKMFVDILKGFDMGSAEGAGTYFTLRNGA